MIKIRYHLVILIIFGLALIALSIRHSQQTDMIDRNHFKMETGALIIMTGISVYLYWLLIFNKKGQTFSM